MNACSCNVCNNKVFHHEHFPHMKLAQQAPEEVVLSIHDRLDMLYDYLSLHRIPEEKMDEMASIMEEISSIDDQLRDLSRYDRGGGELTLDVGEISKKLY